MRLSKEEWQILGGLLLIIFVFSGLLYYDLNKKQSFGNRQIIGLVTFKKNVVQRKFDSQVTWAQVEKNSPLANRDTVLSSDFSDAVIQLNDGTEIQVDENTMLFLEMSGKNTNINFSDGSIKIKKGSSGDLTIQSKDKTIDVEKGDIKLEKSKDRNLNLYVNEGTATVKDGKSSKQIGKEQQAEFGKDGVSVKNTVISLVSPENQKTEYISSRSVNFKWKKNSEIKSSSIEISKRRDFSGKTRKIDSGNSSATISLEDEGTYYWRVVGINEKTNQKEYSETRKLTVFKKDELKLLSPLDGSVVYFSSSLPKIDFNWKGFAREGGYKFQISKTQSFSEIFRSVDVKSNYFSIDSLQEGKYFWRILSKSVTGSEEKSATRQLIIAKRAAESPQTEEQGKKDLAESSQAKDKSKKDLREPSSKDLSKEKKSNLDPKTKETKTMKAISPVNSEVDVAKEKAIRFKWSKQEGAKSYIVKIYDLQKKNMKPVFQEEVNSTNLTFTDLSLLGEGNFAWTVYAKNSSGENVGNEIKTNFRIVAKSRLKNLKPTDIKFTSPKTIYKEGQK